MTRPARPLNFRKLTPQEHSMITPRERKYPVPAWGEFLDMLDKAVNFSKTHEKFLPTLEIWWKHTTEYKTREKIIKSWCNVAEFGFQYFEWRRIAERNKTARFYHFGDNPDEPIEYDPPFVDVDVDYRDVEKFRSTTKGKYD